MYMDSLNSAIDNHADDFVTNTVDITLSLVEDEWKINATDDVIDAMVGGMMTSLSSLGDSFGEIEESQEPTETTRTNPANLGDYIVEIKSATVTQDYDGNPAVIITYSWTNNSGETHISHAIDLNCSIPEWSLAWTRRLFMIILPMMAICTLRMCVLEQQLMYRKHLN